MGVWGGVVVEGRGQAPSRVARSRRMCGEVARIEDDREEGIEAESIKG